MDAKYGVTSVLVKIARFMTKGSGDIEKIFYTLDRLGVVWSTIMRAIALLHIDRVILAPTGHRLVPIPLFMSSSEQNVLQILKPKLGEVVVDVGTYYGRYTLIASQYVGNSGLVIGIEADLDNYCVTKKNIETNGINNVRLIRSAAANCEGTIKLYKTERLGTPSIVWDKRAKYETVPCQTVDKLLADSGVRKVDWLKIDVEGAELMVLEGSRKILAENEKLRLVIEIHTSSDSVLKFLKKMDYKISFLEKQGKIPYHILATRNQ